MADQVEQASEALAAAQLSPKAAPAVQDSGASTFSYAAAAAAPAAPVAPVPAPTTTKKVLHLVIDSGAIIKGTNLGVLAEVSHCVHLHYVATLRVAGKADGGGAIRISGRSPMC
jgi:hypothetical protein